MATTIKSIEIAELLHAALTAVMPTIDGAKVPVYAQGVKTTIDGAVDANSAENKQRCPAVNIIVHERQPYRFGSVLRAFPVVIRAVSIHAHDPFQVDLYTLSQAVAEWIAQPGALVLTLAEFDALVQEDSPDYDTEEEHQYFEWTLSLKTRQT